MRVGANEMATLVSELPVSRVRRGVAPSLGISEIELTTTVSERFRSSNLTYVQVEDMFSAIC